MMEDLEEQEEENGTPCENCRALAKTFHTLSSELGNINDTYKELSDLQKEVQLHKATESNFHLERIKLQDQLAELQKNQTVDPNSFQDLEEFYKATLKQKDDANMQLQVERNSEKERREKVENVLQTERKKTEEERKKFLEEIKSLKRQQTLLLKKPATPSRASLKKSKKGILLLGRLVDFLLEGPSRLGNLMELRPFCAEYLKWKGEKERQWDEDASFTSGGGDAQNNPLDSLLEPAIHQVPEAKKIQKNNPTSEKQLKNCRNKSAENSSLKVVKSRKHDILAQQYGEPMRPTVVAKKSVSVLFKERTAIAEDEEQSADSVGINEEQLAKALEFFRKLHKLLQYRIEKISSAKTLQHPTTSTDKGVLEDICVRKSSRPVRPGAGSKGRRGKKGLKVHFADEDADQLDDSRGSLVDLSSSFSNSAEETVEVAVRDVLNSIVENVVGTSDYPHNVQKTKSRASRAPQTYVPLHTAKSDPTVGGNRKRRETDSDGSQPSLPTKKPKTCSKNVQSSNKQRTQDSPQKDREDTASSDLFITPERGSHDIDDEEDTRLRNGPFASTPRRNSDSEGEDDVELSLRIDESQSDDAQLAIDENPPEQESTSNDDPDNIGVENSSRPPHPVAEEKEKKKRGRPSRQDDKEREENVSPEKPKRQTPADLAKESAVPIGRQAIGQQVASRSFRPNLFAGTKSIRPTFGSKVSSTPLRNQGATVTTKANLDSNSDFNKLRKVIVALLDQTCKSTIGRTISNLRDVLCEEVGKTPSSAELAEHVIYYLTTQLKPTDRMMHIAKHVDVLKTDGEAANTNFEWILLGNETRILDFVSSLAAHEDWSNLYHILCVNLAKHLHHPSRKDDRYFQSWARCYATFCVKCGESEREDRLRYVVEGLLKHQRRSDSLIGAVVQMGVINPCQLRAIFSCADFKRLYQPIFAHRLSTCSPMLKKSVESVLLKIMGDNRDILLVPDPLTINSDVRLAMCQTRGYLDEKFTQGATSLKSVTFTSQFKDQLKLCGLKFSLLPPQYQLDHLRYILSEVEKSAGNLESGGVGLGKDVESLVILLTELIPLCHPECREGVAVEGVDGVVSEYERWVREGGGDASAVAVVDRLKTLLHSTIH